MAERAVGLACDAREIAVGDLAAGERTDDLDRDFGIGPAGEGRDGFCGELRPAFGHIQPAVAGETRQRDVDEAERRGFAPGGHITQGAFLPLARDPMNPHPAPGISR